VIGISKQAVNQYSKRQSIFDLHVSNLLIEVDELRADHPGCGVEKMYYTLRPSFLGRDQFVDLLMNLGYRVKHKKNYRRTTIGSKLYYPNLIQGVEVIAPSMIWQSDITYIEVGLRFYYAVFIIDVFTRKIVGHQVSDHMRATANVKALLLGLESHDAPKIHHSDRGSQYIYSEYLNILKSKGTNISMGLIAQDNAYAERINRTIKEEYLDHWKPQNYPELVKMVQKAVDNYNQKRLHDNLFKLTPQQCHDRFKKGLLDDRFKTVIYSEN
jgi:transposase InsO family protein